MAKSILLLSLVIFVSLSGFAAAQTIANLSLSSTSGNNVTTDNLTCSYALNDTATTAAVAWTKNSTPLMLLYMPFEGNSANALLDYSGSGKVVMNVGSAVWNATGGYDGNGSFPLSGSTQYLSTPQIFSSTNASAPYTALLWIKTTDTQAGIITQYSGTGGFGFEIRASVLDYRNAGTISATTTKSIIDGKWHQIGFTKNSSGGITIYIDGLANGTGTALNTFQATTTWFGNYNPAGWDLTGTIDDVRIYNYSLSPQQILALYQNKTNVMAPQELHVGDVWQCQVTPFNASAAGATTNSNSVTINANASAPAISVALNSPVNSYNSSLSTVNFNWTCSNNFSSFLSNLTVDGTLNASSIVSLNNVSINRTVTGLADGNHNWSVTCWNGTNSGISARYNFTVDTVNPAITFNTPTTNTTAYTTLNYVSANVSAINAGGIKNITIYLYNSTGLYNSTTGTASTLFINWTGLPNGIYYFNATAYDNAGNFNKTETRNVTITTPISVTLNSPITSYNSSSSTVNFNWTCSNNFSSFLSNLTVDGVINANGIPSPNGMAVNRTVTGIADGNHSWSATCWNDTTSSTSALYNFTVDTANPAIAFMTPTDNSSAALTRRYVNINVTAINAGGIKNVTIYLYNSTGALINSSTGTSSQLFANFSVNADGIYYFNATAYDNAGNFNKTETRNVTITAVIISVVNVTLNSPVNGYNSSSSTVNFNWTCSNNFTSFLSNLTVDGVLNASNIASLNNIAVNKSVVFADGNHNWNVVCWNGTNFNTSALYNFTVDTVNPAMVFMTPTTNTTAYTTLNYVSANVSAINAGGIKNITIYLYNSVGGLVSSSNSTSSPLFVNFTGLSNGAYYFNATAYDNAGNFNKTETRNVTINASTGGVPSITGLNLNSTSGNNFITDNLTCNYALSANATTSAVAWYQNNNPIMVLYLPFDGNSTNALLDYSGYENHATVANGAFWNASGGYNGSSAYVFDGLNDYISVPNDATLNRADGITLVARVMRNDRLNDNYTQVLSKNGSYVMFISDNRSRVYCGNSTAWVRTKESPIIPNRWQTIACVINGSNISIYMDTGGTPSYPSAPIYALGDSVTSGTPDHKLAWHTVGGNQGFDGGNLTRLQDSYPYWLDVYARTYVGSESVNKSAVVQGGYEPFHYNKGIYGGYCTEFLGPTTHAGNGTAFDFYNVEVPNGSTVISMCGINDLYSGRSVAQIETNISQLYNRSVSKGDHMILMAITPNNYVSCANVKTINTWLKNFSTTNNIPFVDTWTPMVKASDNCSLDTPYDSGDGLHPSSAGEKAIALAIWRTVFNNQTWNNTAVQQATEVVNGWTGIGSTNSGPLYIGALANGSYPINASIDYVQVYQRALSAQELGRIFNNSPVMVSQELQDGDSWQCQVTPFNASAAGATTNSNSVTINANFTPPSVSVALNSPVNGYNSSSSTVNFNWTCSGDSGSFLANLTVDGTVNANGISSPNNTAVNRTVANLAEGNHSWSVTCWNGNSATSALYNFTVDTVNPAITFNTPTTNTTAYTTLNYVSANVSAINAGGIKNITIYLYNSTGLYNSTIGMTGSLFINWTGLPNGIYYFNATAYDNAGNFNKTETRNVTITAVIISVVNVTLNSPVNGYNSSSSSVNFNWTCSNNFTSFLSNLTVDGVLNASNIASLNNIAVNKSVVFADGNHNWNVVCWNGTNFNTSALYNFTVDTVNPAITFVTPTDNSSATVTRSFIQINVTANGGTFKNVTILLYNSTGLYNSINGTTSPLFINWTGLPNGIYYFNATAYDNAGNFNKTETRNVTINASTGGLPSITGLSLSSTSGNNLVTDNLTCNYALSGSATTAAVAWYRNSGPTMALYMPMEGNSANELSDYSGNGNNGTNVGSVLWNATGGHDGNGSFTFSGANCITVNRSASLNITRNITMTAWIRKTPGAAAAYGDLIIMPYTSQVTPYAAYAMVFGASNNIMMYLSNGAENNFAGTTTMSTGTWYFVAATYNGTTMTVYVNGAPDGSHAFTGPIQTVATNISIGCAAYPAGSAFYFNGSIDDARIYNRSLSAQEIMALYQNRSNTIVSQELSVGDSWQCQVTPFNASAAGTTSSSNSVTINANASVPAISVALNSPVNGYNSSSSSVNFNWTCSNNFTSFLSNLTVDGVINTNNIVSLNNVSINQTVTGLADGNHSWSVTCWNGTDSGISALYNFTVDTVNPAITFNTPTTNTTAYTTLNYISANVSAINAGGIKNITIYLYNSTGLYNSTTGAASTLFVNWTALPNGIYYFNATAYDNAGNFNKTETRNVTIDTVNPAITFATPTDNSSTAVSRTFIQINVSVTDSGSGIKNVTIYLYNSTGLYDSTNGATSTLFMNWTALPDGVYYFNATSYDNANNFNKTETRNVTILTTVSVTPNGPQEDYSSSSSTVNFNWTCFGAFGSYLSNLTVDGVPNASSIASPNNIAVSKSVIFADGNHNWNVVCWNGTNFNTSALYNFTVDTVNPAIDFTTPTENSGAYLSRSNLVINVTASDGNFANLSVFVYNSTGGIVRYNSTASTQFFVNYTGLANGVYYFNATAYDNAGNFNKTETRNVTIDTANPAILLVGPTMNTTPYSALGYIAVNATASDANLKNLTIYLYNATELYNVTTTAATNLFINWTGLPDGVYSFNATAFDSANNMNQTETRSMNIDTANPEIQFTSPTDNAGTILNRNYVQINVSATDTNLKNITIYIYNSTGGLVNSSNGTASPMFVNFTGLSNGVYYFNATAYDNAGNMDKTETRNITIDTVNPAITFNTPTDNSSATATRSFIQINVSATDSGTGISGITAYIYNSTGALVNSSDSATSPLFINWTGLSNGIYYFNATAYDNAGNFNKTETRNMTLGETINCPVLSTAGQAYVMGNDFFGAPNDATPQYGATCVKITASNVTFDCNGYSITNNGTGGQTFGILLVSDLTNVTVKNCQGVSGYTDDIYSIQQVNICQYSP